MKRWMTFLTTIGLLGSSLPALGAGPAIDGALSLKAHDTGVYGLDLLAAVEPRAGGVSELEVTFDTAIDPTSVAGHIEIVDEVGTAYTGFTTDLSGAVLTLTLDPALSQHCFTVSFAGLESTTGDVSDASMQFIALEGDVTGDAIVNSIDYSSIKPYYGEDVDVDTFVYDLSVSGPVINTIDSAFVKARFGTAVSCGEFMTAELAGNSLDDYPYFEYVLAFNENATVEIAIDPTRFPDIVGETCDLYVVESKTVAQWDGDKALADVTSGVETVTFAGGTIQANTVTVADAYDLDGDAGIGLGVPYDVVLDCDGNGVLSGGDYIDGYGEVAGLYAMRDTTKDGPLAVTEIVYSGSLWETQNTFYPTSIGSMGKLPLVVVSHGNGHWYEWYDHIGFHMASCGYVVMSHKNNTGPGIPSCLITTLTNTDYLLAKQGVIAGGVLNGHIDSSRITWIGHSRGAEGVAAAFDRLYDGTFTPTHYDKDDIVLISSMLPTDFLGTSSSNPHNANYHLWTASGDADVGGYPNNDIAQTFHLHDRATQTRHSSVVQGAGHGDFHNGGGSSVFSGPCPIGRSRTHDVELGYFLPLIKHYVEGNIPATDFLWRQWEHFHPITFPYLYCSTTGDNAVVISSTYRLGEAAADKFVIDDYQSYTSLTQSSSGGSVSFNVTNAWEGRNDDQDTSYSWVSSDEMNGMIYGRSSDTTRGVVFDWNTNRYYQLGIIASERDLSDDEYLSFRAAQGTRHPYTTSVKEDLTFTVTLRDGSGTTSSINIGAYGGGLEEPYQRTGYGSGAGWHNECETIRIRLTDFQTNGSGLDLTDIEVVRFEFGPSYGSSQGRIVLDDVEIINQPIG